MTEEHSPGCICSDCRRRDENFLDSIAKQERNKALREVRDALRDWFTNIDSVNDRQHCFDEACEFGRWFDKGGQFEVKEQE